MPLKLFDSKDAIPEALREGAIETKDGKFAVSDEEGLKESQRRLLDEKKKTDERLANLETALGGLKPDEVTSAVAARKTAEEEAARKAGDFDKVLEKRVNETKAEYEKRIAELAPYKTKYEDRELEIAIRDAATKAGVPGTDLPFVLDITKGRRVRLDEKTGKPVVFDREGDPTGLSVEKFFAETFKAEAPKFYGPAGGSGGGATQGGGSRSSGTVAATDEKAFLANLDGIAKGEVAVTF